MQKCSCKISSADPKLYACLKPKSLQVQPEVEPILKGRQGAICFGHLSRRAADRRQHGGEQAHWARKNGHLDCLKYLHEHGCPWDEGTCLAAAKNGHLNCLNYGTAATKRVEL